MRMCPEYENPQNFDIGPSFYFIECRRWKLEKKIRKITKVFCHKIKTKA